MVLCRRSRRNLVMDGSGGRQDPPRKRAGTLQPLLEPQSGEKPVFRERERKKPDAAAAVAVSAAAPVLLPWFLQGFDKTAAEAAALAAAPATVKSGIAYA